MKMKIGKVYKAKRETISISFIVMFLLAMWIVFSLAATQRDHNISSAEHLVESEKSKLQYALDSRLMDAKILEMMVISHNGEVENFEYVAQKLYSKDGAVRSLQLAPDGIVTYVYPMEGNERAFFNLFEDPEQKKEAEWARDTGRMTLAGPYELKQGGMGLIARRPIYLPNEDGTKEFWGFSTVVLNIPQIFNIANLQLLSDRNYYYRLWRKDPNTGAVQTIAENTDQPLKNPVQSEMDVPNGIWYFSLAPHEGWVPIKRFVSECVVAFVIVVLSTLTLAGFITVLKQKGELQTQNNTDSLTKIRNGRYCMKKIKSFGEQKMPFAIFYLDMNNFKQINDVYGHDTGDKVLKEVASRIQHSIRGEDIAARIGGDEFTVTIPGETTEEFCEEIRERLKENVGQIFTTENATFYPQISVGYARYPAEADGIETVMRLADARMYEEKRRMKKQQAEEQG